MFGKRRQILRYFADIPSYQTERLLLRRILPKDAADMYEYARLPIVTEHLLWSPHSSYSYTARYIDFLQIQYREMKFYDWAIVWRPEEKMIGTCGFASLDFRRNAGEIGYVLNPDYWGRGIAQEAVRTVMNVGFTQFHLHRIFARYMLENQASRHVMDRCGMTYVGTEPDPLLVKGTYRKIGVCSMSRNAFYSQYELSASSYDDVGWFRRHFGKS